MKKVVLMGSLFFIVYDVLVLIKAFVQQIDFLIQKTVDTVETAPVAITLYGTYE